MKATILIPKDKTDRHHITIPIEIWNAMELKQGDLIEVDFVQKIQLQKKAGD